MDIKKLVSEIKNEGYKKPEVFLLTPEIRTCDERVGPMALPPKKTLEDFEKDK